MCATTTLKEWFLIHIKMEQKIQQEFPYVLAPTLCCSSLPSPPLSPSLPRVLCLQLMHLCGNIIITESPWFIIYIRLAFWYSTFQAHNNVCCQCVGQSHSQSRQLCFLYQFLFPSPGQSLFLFLLLFCLSL